MVRVRIYGKGKGFMVRVGAYEGCRFMVRVGVYGKGGGFMVRVEVYGKGGGLW